MGTKTQKHHFQGVFLKPLLGKKGDEQLASFFCWDYNCYHFLGGGNSKMFGISTSKIGEDVTHFFDEHTFQRGWFNHQPATFREWFIFSIFFARIPMRICLSTSETLTHDHCSTTKSAGCHFRKGVHLVIVRLMSNDLHFRICLCYQEGVYLY